MILKINFDSEEALYVQLCNQIILGIATDMLREGDSLPSVRQLADEIGINMHTVNKAYSVLRQEGFLRLDRRRGAVVALNMDRLRALNEMRESLARLVARGICKNVGRAEVHALVDEIFDQFGGQE
ncbi:MAG: GntR family transcriptional regulator [Lachnospiraceae bacterium]|jgi:GntR family transcriptional regulator|nr:GntR family transcriptional regulator [Lachnospiraceae bacterium]